MFDRPEAWAWLGRWLQDNWPGLYAGILAVIIAALRVVYGGGSLRRVLIEAPLCGALALAASHGLSLIGVTSDTAPFFGGVIGLLGVEGIRAIFIKFFTQKKQLP